MGCISAKKKLKHGGKRSKKLKETDDIAFVAVKVLN